MSWSLPWCRSHSTLWDLWDKLTPPPPLKTALWRGHLSGSEASLFSKALHPVGVPGRPRGMLFTHLHRHSPCRWLHAHLYNTVPACGSMHTCTHTVCCLWLHAHTAPVHGFRHTYMYTAPVHVFMYICSHTVPAGGSMHSCTHAVPVCGFLPLHMLPCTPVQYSPCTRLHALTPPLHTQRCTKALTLPLTLSRRPPLPSSLSSSLSTPNKLKRDVHWR